MLTKFKHRIFPALVLLLTILLFARIAFAANGRVISGDCKNGWGTFLFDNGDKYDGSFVDGKMSGPGTFTYANGDKYEGDYKYGQMDGFGTYTFANGEKYSGNFKNNMRSGIGTMTLANGSEYVGAWENNMMNGFGEFKDVRGFVYSGTWKDNKTNGYGTLTLADGAKFIGIFKTGKRNGYGTQYDAKGAVVEQGMWAGDVYVPGSNVKVPPMLEKLTTGMTKDKVLKILGRTTTPPDNEKTAIDTKKDDWDYYDIDIFKHIEVQFDNNKVSQITLYVSDDKVASKNAISDLIGNVQKGQTLKEVLSTVGYPQYFMIYLPKTWVDIGASYSYEDNSYSYLYIVFYKGGLVSLIDKTKAPKLIQ